MKKTVLSLGLITLCSSYTSQADTLLGLYAGVQTWGMETSGGFSTDGTNVDFNFNHTVRVNFYAALEHPIPLIPNIKLQRTNMDTDGDATLNTNFTFGGELFALDTVASSFVQLDSTDIILYYELLDNDLISFDVGLNVKYVDGELSVRAQDDPSLRAFEAFSGPVPMAYSRIEVGIPFSGFGAFVEGSFLAVDDHTLSDFQAAITYSLLDNIVIDLTFQVGYRAVSLELDDLDDIFSDLEFKGAFAGVEVHF